MNWQRAFNISIGILFITLFTWIGTSLGNVQDIVINEALKAQNPYGYILMETLKAINTVDPYLTAISFVSSIITFIKKSRVSVRW